MAKIAIDLPDELLKSIDDRCEMNTPSISRSTFIHLALAEYIRTEGEQDKKLAEEQRAFWEREETEEELDAWIEQASMVGLREFYKDEPPWPERDESR